MLTYPLKWMYTGLAVAATVAGILFWILFHQYNETEDSMNALEMDQGENEKAVPANEVGMTRKNDVERN